MLNQLAITETGNTTLDNIIVVSGSFLILLALLKHFAQGLISGILKKREDKTTDDLGSTEQSRINSARIKQECGQQLLVSRFGVANTIKSAKESGELSRQNILKDAQKKAAHLKSKAQADTTVERDSTLNSVKNDVAELSLQIAERILNKELSPEMHESLIDRYIEDLGSSNKTR